MNTVDLECTLLIPDFTDKIGFTWYALISNYSGEHANEAIFYKQHTKMLHLQNVLDSYISALVL